MTQSEQLPQYDDTKALANEPENPSGDTTVEAQITHLARNVARPLARAIRGPIAELAALREEYDAQQQRLLALETLVAQQSSDNLWAAELTRIAAELAEALTVQLTARTGELDSQLQHRVEDGMVALNESKNRAVEAIVQNKQEVLQDQQTMLIACMQKLDAQVQRTDTRLAEIVQGVQNARVEADTHARAAEHSVFAAIEARQAAEEAAHSLIPVSEQVRHTASAAEEAQRQAERQVEQLQSQIARVTNLDNVITVMYDVIRAIHVSAGAAPAPSAPPIAITPVIATDLSPIVSATDSVVNPSPKAVPAAMTPQQPEFDYFTAFLRLKKPQWSELLQAAREKRADYFTPSRLRNLDLALYGDVQWLVGNNPEYQEWGEQVFGFLVEAQERCKEELKQAGLERIEGHPGDRVRPYWLEADQRRWEPTNNPKLAGTWCNTEPGNGGYSLDDKALRPTVARFYRLV